MQLSGARRERRRLQRCERGVGSEWGAKCVCVVCSSVVLQRRSVVLLFRAQSVALAQRARPLTMRDLGKERRKRTEQQRNNVKNITIQS